MKKYTCLFTFFLFLFCFSQKMTTKPPSIQENLWNSFNKLKWDDSIIFSYDTKEELIKAYLQKIYSYKPMDVNENYLSFYSKPEGMQVIIKKFILNSNSQEKKYYQLKIF